ncbi:Uncharacterized protein involved in exopolysaccharide biosynthesis [Tranquillimonas rosea]|uniref:Uncharacterized protein involved in exopolysaccharide biosynthesis n=1 Tax=Tranquillimonas rosea TaxID=641238 RepID=A0A1H9WTD5_9RHOB|nr:Wzz/FepE/Etk N-terminal domain-containing protein [Tranquillimonas rosea]SES36937.1 Uncharacterized protein involved in exopolysaccharide biosynthesis [Tranquillimonas rosea]
MGWLPSGGQPSGDGPQQSFDIRAAARAIRRQIPLIALCAFAGLCIAIMLILGSIPQFRAVETVLLDEERNELLEEVSPIPNAVYTNSAVQSEVEIIKSKTLALKVVDSLSLHEDEAFMNPPASLGDKISGLVSSVTDPIADMLEPAPQPTAGSDGSASGGETAEEPTDPTTEARERAASILRSGLSVDRVGRSFVINIGFEGYDPIRVRDIARAYGTSYRTFQLEATREVAANAGEWIQQRLDELEQRSLDAAAEVQRFRSENDLVQVRGDLLTEQQQSEMASELIQASAQTAQVRARLESLQSLLDAPAGEALGVAALQGSQAGGQEILSELRREYFNSRRRYLSITEEFGEDHPQAQQLQDSITSLETAIREEVRRAVRSVEAEFDIARSREESLRNDLDAITKGSGQDVAVLGRLNQLETVAETYQTVYRDYLERYELTTQQEAFPIASVQIISEAEKPTGASSPQKKMMLATWLFLGILVGASIGGVRELRPRRFRTRHDVESWLGLTCAGLRPKGRHAKKDSGKGLVAHQTMMRVVQAIDRRRRSGHPVVVGLAPVTADPDFADTVATLVSSIGAVREARFLVADAGGLDKAAHKALKNQRSLEIADRSQLAAMLPDPAADPAAADRAAEFPAGFDYVLVLMPPLTRLAGVDTVSRHLDATVLTIPWGKVGTELAEGALADHQDFRSRLVTAILDGADLKAARLYMPSGNYEEQVINA